MNNNNLNDNQITVVCGLSIGLLGKARRGDSDLGKKSIEKILTFYPDINKTWLLTGEGEMLKPAKNPFSQMTVEKIKSTATETIAEDLIKLLKSGDIYLAEVHDRIVAEKNAEIEKRDKQIEGLRREIWELEKKLEDATK